MPILGAQLPLAVARDLLGLTRALYAAELAAGAPEELLAELRSIGKKLVLALDLASRTEPDTMGHRAAWGHAEEATRRIGELFQEPILKGAAAAMGKRLVARVDRGAVAEIERRRRVERRERRR